MSVRGYFKLACSRAIRRGREIMVLDTMGIKNFVARSWLCITIDVFIGSLSCSSRRECAEIPSLSGVLSCSVKRTEVVFAQSLSIPVLLPSNQSILCQYPLLGYFTIASKVIF
jgi:hypothetical protein